MPIALAALFLSDLVRLASQKARAHAAKQEKQVILIGIRAKGPQTICKCGQRAERSLERGSTDKPTTSAILPSGQTKKRRTKASSAQQKVILDLQNHYIVHRNTCDVGWCHAVGCAGFFFVSCSSPADCAGLNRQDRLFRYSDGPKTEPKHRAAWQSTVRNRPECTNIRSGHQIQNYRSLAWRSPQMSIANIVIILVTSSHI